MKKNTFVKAMKIIQKNKPAILAELAVAATVGAVTSVTEVAVKLGAIKALGALEKKKKVDEKANEEAVNND